MSLTFGPELISGHPITTEKVTVQSWDRQPVTLVTPVTIDAGGRVSFSVSEPGIYRVNVISDAVSFSASVTLSLGPDFDPSNIRSMVDWSVDKILDGGGGGGGSGGGGGVPVGGTTGQVLSKSSDTDYATAWSNTFDYLGEDVVIGDGAQVTGSASVAVGINTESEGDYSVSVGAYSTAIGEATAVGGYAAARGFSSVAIGVGATSTQRSDVAIGGGASANGGGIYNGSVAIGGQAKVPTDHYGSVAIGYQAETTGPNQAHLRVRALRVSVGDVGSGPQSYLVLQSPDGSEWAIGVADDGSVVASEFTS